VSPSRLKQAIYMETPRMSRATGNALTLVFISLLVVLPLPGQTPGVELKVAAVQFRSSFDIFDNTKRMSEALDRLSACPGGGVS